MSKFLVYCTNPAVMRVAVEAPDMASAISTVSGGGMDVVCVKKASPNFRAGNLVTTAMKCPERWKPERP